MTIETRITVEPKDIVAVEYECPKCHARSVRSLEPERGAIAPRACGSCSTPYVLESGEATDLAAFLSSLIRYKNVKLPFTLRFEVAGLGASASEKADLNSRLARSRGQSC